MPSSSLQVLLIRGRCHKKALLCGAYIIWEQDCFRRWVGRDLLKEPLEIQYSNTSKTFLHHHKTIRPHATPWAMEKKWTAKPLHLQLLLSSSNSFESIHRSFHSRIQGSHTSPRFLESVAWNANPEIRRTLESTWESKGPIAIMILFSFLKGFKDSLPALFFFCRSPSYGISSNAWMLWILHQCHLTASFFVCFAAMADYDSIGENHLMPGFGPHTPSHPRRFFSFEKRGHFSVGRWLSWGVTDVR